MSDRLGRGISGVIFGLLLITAGVLLLKNRDRIRRHNREMRGSGYWANLMDSGDALAFPLLAGALILGGIAFATWSVGWAMSHS
jgi:hypothetical protein